jgi:alpha-tubulin suppressor-like RCC1 family protein
MLFDCGHSSSIVITTDNTIIGWGQNLYGSIGDGTTVQRQYPVVSLKGNIGSRTITQLACGSYHTVVLAGGLLYSWGLNTQNQLGDGTAVTRYFPVLVYNAGAILGKNITSVAVGGNYNVILTAGVFIRYII